MRQLARPAALVSLALLAFGCSPRPESASFDFYVDAGSGDDANDGSAANPFKTITKALSVAVSGESISVAPGTYDAANGETFPLDMAAGVTLVGDERNKGAGPASTEIVDDGGVVLLPDADCVVAGFWIRTLVLPIAATGVDLVASRVTLRNNTITHHETYGVHVRSGSSHHVITGNEIVENGPPAGTTGTGLAFLGGGAGSEVANNTIRENGIGVEVDTADVDLGGGAAGSAGGNDISCNRGNDLVSGSTAVSARNGMWDDTPPSEAAVAGDGGDLLADDPWDVDVTGASLASTSCPFYDYYVDANDGDDANAGTQAAPFESIGEGLDNAISGETVKVAPGRYDTANGESFPILIPTGITLLGDPRTRGQGAAPTRILGGGTIAGAPVTAAVQLGDGATLRGFEVTNDRTPVNNNVGVSLGFPALAGSMANVLDNALVDNAEAGLDARNNVDDLLVDGNLVSGNRDGMNFVDAGFDSTIANNDVISNTGSGIIFRGNGLVGRSTDVSPDNILSCNLQADLAIGAAPGFDVDATNNLWDHAPPTQGFSAVGGIDVAHGGVSYSVTGASAAPSPCP